MPGGTGIAHENSNIFELPRVAQRQFSGRHLIGPYYLGLSHIGVTNSDRHSLVYGEFQLSLTQEERMSFSVLTYNMRKIFLITDHSLGLLNPYESGTFKSNRSAVLIKLGDYH